MSDKREDRDTICLEAPRLAILNQREDGIKQKDILIQIYSKTRYLFLGKLLIHNRVIMTLAVGKQRMVIQILQFYLR